MILRHSLAVCAVLLLAIVKGISAQGSPTILSESGTKEVTVGDSVILGCKVDNLGSSANKISWTFLTHDITIYQGGLLMTDNPTKYSIIRPADSSAYNLQILEVETSDEGFYKCQIDGTDQAIIIHLVDQKRTAPVVTNPSPLNRTECCLERNIKEECLPACNPYNLNPLELNSISACVENSTDGLVDLVHCLTAGSNHENCCLFKGLDPLCLSFCRNDVPKDVGSEHEKCLQMQPLGIMLSCVSEGIVYLPNEPQDVSVIVSNIGQTSFIQVSWKPPSRNADKVTGYKIMYKRSDMNKYFSVIKNNPTSKYARLSGVNIIPNRGYDVYVAAISEDGVSDMSIEVSVFIPDQSLNTEQAKDIDECCENRKVSDSCRSELCQSKTWSNPDIDSLSRCFLRLGDIFTCLVGEQDHTGCCTAFGVSSVCLPLCSGHPPPFNDSLIVCTQQMAIIEACVQQGYQTLPSPPTNLVLKEIGTDMATLTFKSSPTSGLVRYIVLLREGEESNALYEKYGYLTPGSESLILTNLTADTFYSVHITAENADAGSLPSQTVHFMTYPDILGQPTIPPVINIPHDFTECCYKKGMPDICAQGCRYLQNISTHYAANLGECYSHIGSVLSCAADGRDHEACCIQKNVTDSDCLDLCGIAADGPLDDRYIKCLKDTPKAVTCFEQGLTELPRYPNAFVDAVTKNTISLKWEHPNTSTLIETYIVQYRSSGQTKFIEKETNQTYYILNNLLSTTEYEITIRSRNENGTSSPSPLIRQYTLSADIIKPDFNKTVVTGRHFWNNISHCCHSSGITDGCINQCLNKHSDTSDSQCTLESHKMLACYADGEDHGECCRENPNLPSVCASICSGHVSGLTVDIALCMGHGHRDIILSCYLASAGLIPTSPVDMFVLLKEYMTVRVNWGKPTKYCGTDCKSDIHYWREDPNDPGARMDMKIISGVNSPYDLTISGVEGYYTFTVTARNTYGSSRPSSLQTLFVTPFRKDVKVTLQSLTKYVEKGSNAILQCATNDFNPNDPYTIKWLYNGRRKLDSTSKDGHLLYLTAVDPVKDEGSYSCVVKDSVIAVTDTLFLPIQYTPKYSENRDETAMPDEAKQAKVACWFNGFPDTSAQNWKKDGKAIRFVSTKYSPGVDKRYHTGITAYRLKIANVETSDYGMYSIDVSNKFGKSSCQVELRDPRNLTTIIPARKKSDPKGCCAAQGVSELCQQLCSFDIDLEEVVKDSAYQTCLASFTSLIKCTADGRDHRKCCKDKGVDPFCFPFCAGQSPGSHITDQIKLLTCVSESTKIFACAEQGQKFSPFPPTNVMVSWWSSNTKIQVRWSRPKFNQDMVESYVIYYKSTSNPTEQHAGVNEHVQEYYIPNPIFTDRYEVYVISSNKGGQSLKSNVATLEPLSLGPPTNVKVSSISSTSAVVSWTPTGSDSSIQYVVHYKMKNGARYEKTQNIPGTSYVLKSLKPVSEYVVYVTSISTDSYQSVPSVHFSFSTEPASITTESGTGSEPGSKKNKGGSSDDTDKIAIAIGVVVAIIAIVIIVIIVYVTFKGRGALKSTSDTVAFENPIAGSSGSVKIHGMGGSTDDSFNYGRLEEENAYDNSNSTVAASGGASFDGAGAYENPAYAGQEMKEPSTGAATLELSSDNV